MGNLPVYTAPDKAWTVIEKTLRKKRGIIFFNPDMLLKIAAIIVIILAIGFLIKDRTVQQNITKTPIANNTPTKQIETPLEKKIVPKEITTANSDVSKEIIASTSKKTKVKPRIKVSEMDAIAKTELVSMPKISTKTIKTNKQEKGVSKPKKIHQQKSATRKTPQIKKVKLSIHNDKDVPQKSNKRQISFAFFKPHSRTVQKADSIKRSTKPVFAASINL